MRLTRGRTDRGAPRQQRRNAWSSVLMALTVAACGSGVASSRTVAVRGAAEVTHAPGLAHDALSLRFRVNGERLPGQRADQVPPGMDLTASRIAVEATVLHVSWTSSDAVDWGYSPPTTLYPGLSHTVPTWSVVLWREGQEGPSYAIDVIFDRTSAQPRVALCGPGAWASVDTMNGPLTAPGNTVITGTSGPPEHCPFVAAAVATARGSTVDVTMPLRSLSGLPHHLQWVAAASWRDQSGTELWRVFLPQQPEDWDRWPPNRASFPMAGGAPLR